MRRDWNYVGFADYSADMDEMAQRSAAIIGKLKDERDQFRNLLWAVLRKTGPIKVDDDASCKPAGEFIFDRMIEDKTLCLKAVLTPSPECDKPCAGGAHGEQSGS